ncbi:protein N-terminal asparagine amidohydrolase [Daphnia magna]|uniref:protein N-terminal asparagine amidohydrolase n=1 Tax=Daphnia magna TaxID=35525 RepID=UPI001E1BB559|nr:protein N-terminal asparagine amidohydrolase [Daphnia magna]
MTITIASQSLSQLPETVAEIYQQFPSLETEALKLVQTPLCIIDKPEGVLYVTQKEYAVLKNDDENLSMIGTDDATTCHIVVLVNRKESSVCVAHIDSTDDLDEELTRMVLDVMGQQHAESDFYLELSIMGGYRDEMHKSEMLTLDLLQFYNDLPVNFQLKSLCVNSVNTRTSNGINWPIIYGVAVDLQSDFIISPAKFNLNVRGPCLSLRSSRFLSSQCSLQRVYHTGEGIFRINPFSYRYHSQMVDWIHKSDDFILNNFSTSPAVEPEHFPQEMKQVFQFVVHNPFPLASVFKFNKSVKYVPSPQGQWLKL